VADNQDPSTTCARGGWFEEFSTPPSNPPIYQTTAFDLHGLEHLDAVVNKTERGYIYTRDGNPNHAAFAQDVANLEGADSGAVTASGMGALSAILLGNLKSGDHVVAARVLYGRTSQQLEELGRCFGVGVTFVDTNNLDEVAESKNDATKLCLLESVSNPLMEVADVQAIVEIMGDIPVIVDNTFATPCLFRPLDHGAKIVFHSASKYLNGHGDVMLGVVVGDKASMTRVRRVASVFGLNPNPFECWLASRGMKTLPIRMQQVSKSALEIATWLENHAKVARVFYPGLASHPNHETARKVLPQGQSGMLSFELVAGEAGVAPLFRALADTIPFSPTLADTRTTISYPAGTSHKFMNPDERRAWGISDGLVRLSVGLDSANEVVSELEAAINSVPVTP
jgi:O-succinylhomoserine sulfhydrylase